MKPSVFLFCCLCLSVSAQDGLRPVGELPRMEVHRAAGPILVDGQLDEEAWKRAEVVEFVFPWEKQTGAKQKTRARLLWDDENLYVAYECEDSDVRADYIFRDDPTYKDDAVEIFLNPNPKQSAAYIGLEMNARGTLYDYLMLVGQGLLAGLQLDGVKLKTRVNGTLNGSGDTDRGWVLELAIPFRSFEGLAKAKPPAKGEEWRLNLNRWDGTEPNRRLSQWSDSGLPAPNPHRVERFGRVLFVD